MADRGGAPLEKAIAGQIVRELRGLGFHVSSTQQTGPSRQTIGMPDLFVAHPVRKVFAWIEVKRPGKKPTPLQQAWHDGVREAGCPVIVATSVLEAFEGLEELR